MARNASILVIITLFLIQPLTALGGGKELFANEKDRIDAVLNNLPPILADYRFPLAETVRGAVQGGAPAPMVRRLLERAVVERVDFLSLSKFLASLKRAAEAGLPVEKIAGKIHEGLSKKAPPPHIAVVIERYEKRLGRAKGLAEILVRRNIVPGDGRRAERLILSIDHALLQGVEETELEGLFGKVEPNSETSASKLLEEAAGVYGDLRRVGLSAGQAERILIDVVKAGEKDSLARLRKIAKDAADEGLIGPEDLRAGVDGELARGARADDIARFLDERLRRAERESIPAAGPDGGPKGERGAHRPEPPPTGAKERSK